MDRMLRKVCDERADEGVDVSVRWEIFIVLCVHESFADPSTFYREQTLETRDVEDHVDDGRLPSGTCSFSVREDIDPHDQHRDAHTDDVHRLPA